MSDFNTESDYEEEVQPQTRAKSRRRLPLWPLVVILLLILAVLITLWNPFAPPPAIQPTIEVTPIVTLSLPTLTPFPTPSPQPTPTLPTEITVGGYVKVIGAEADQLSYRSGPGMNYARLKLVKDRAILKVLDGPEEADGYIWWRLEDEDGDIGWAAEKWLAPTLP